MNSESPSYAPASPRIAEAALETIARQAPPRHFQAFDLHVRRKWSLLRVARDLGMDPISVYLICRRLTKQLESEVSRLRVQSE